MEKLRNWLKFHLVLVIKENFHSLWFLSNCRKTKRRRNVVYQMIWRLLKKVKHFLSHTNFETNKFIIVLLVEANLEENYSFVLEIKKIRTLSAFVTWFSGYLFKVVDDYSMTKKIWLPVNFFERDNFFRSILDRRMFASNFCVFVPNCIRYTDEWTLVLCRT